MRALSDDRSAPAPSEQLTLLAPSEAPAVRGLDAEPDAEPGAERLLLVPEQQRPAPSGPHPSGRRQADEEVTLSPEQNAAVARRHEPLLLSAGAGSGKTRVLVERFVAAVLEDQMAPSKILAITFTERAAGELRERIRARFLQLGRRETARELERAFVGTFHGFCASVLRAHAWRAGLEGDFAILDEGSARWLRGRAFEQAMRELVAGDREEAVGLLAAYGPERARSIVSSDGSGGSVTRRSNVCGTISGCRSRAVPCPAEWPRRHASDPRPASSTSRAAGTRAGWPSR